jgi:hypothetical protein
MEAALPKGWPMFLERRSVTLSIPRLGDMLRFCENDNICKKRPCGGHNLVSEGF